ncbi:LuxR C-terminal-related transcriptional regulator [Novosphingobium lentum]|uniref:LuxR C-terminal-related transcriptional regulator n=1 Tax=Novosphingobium lentum TaxID=145287 RepID=UPI000AFF73BC|nr:response regulator transcription factor [Novosphingobium lentum]
MYSSRAATAEIPDTCIQAVIVSQVCLVRECIEKSLHHDASIQVVGDCATLDLALKSMENLGPDMILLDAAFAGGATAAARLSEAAGAAQIVAVGLEESEDNILDWAEAGIAGYVADTASMDELPRLLRQIRWGGQSCSSRVVGGLLRRMGRLGKRSDLHNGAALAELTPREQTIYRCISAGLTNKDIARQLNISVGTTKSHVHNILGKLNLTNRAQVAARMVASRQSFDPGEAAFRPAPARNRDTV